VKPILCLDFDGVCHSYTSGWKGAAVIPDPPVPGMEEFLVAAINYFDVAIYSSRSGQEGGIQAMKDWFDQYTITDIRTMLNFPTEKPPAMVGIDDRVLTFNGIWPNLNELVNFKPWNLK